tara:strand:+ start:174 stop:1808 length:1635 start_codon:yes stop_codon:yes gene_type:complete
MTGGLMNLTAYGNENIILNGNPKKTFFRATYNKYTNFGLQRFRIDYEGNRTLNYNSPTEFVFKIPRYAELLHDTYISIQLPDIWSPVKILDTPIQGNILIPYEFKWIEELGAHMIQNIEIFSGGVSLANYPGEYLSCLKERDFSAEKKELWNKMCGNIPELYDPANANGNINVYPNAMYIDQTGVEPSIRGRRLYIPLDAFFCNSSKFSIPLVALQYQEISIKITFNAVSNLYTINDVDNVVDATGLSYRMAPNPNNLDHQMWRFIQPPSDVKASLSSYNQTRNDWNADIHLVGTYIFLGQDERRVLAQNEHKILIKQVLSYDFLGVVGSKIIDIESKDLIVNYMWRFRRSDAFLRNEWSNYTNWAYNNVLPQNITSDLPFNEGVEISNPNTLHITGSMGEYSYNVKDIMLDMGIVMGGVYRENVMEAGVFNLVEKYNRTNGNAKDGLYCYNFCLTTGKDEIQPSGAMNVNRFPYVSFEFNTINAPIDKEGTQVDYICDENGNPIAFRKNVAKLNTYSYDLRVFEERYNVLIISSGRLGLLRAR